MFLYDLYEGGDLGVENLFLSQTSKKTLTYEHVMTTCRLAVLFSTRVANTIKTRCGEQTWYVFVFSLLMVKCSRLMRCGGRGGRRDWFWMHHTVAVKP